MQDNKNFLGTEPVGKLLLKLSIPTVIAQLINMLYNIVDRIYIGHIPGEGSLALTGVGVCMPIIMIVSAFATILCWGKRVKSVLSNRIVPSAGFSKPDIVRNVVVLPAPLLPISATISP